MTQSIYRLDRAEAESAPAVRDPLRVRVERIRAEALRVVAAVERVLIGKRGVIERVLTAMAEGLATKAIALRLDVAVKTVENHKARVFGKLGARNHAHAVTLAIEQGLLSPPSQLVGESRS